MVRFFDARSVKPSFAAILFKCCKDLMNTYAETHLTRVKGLFLYLHVEHIWSSLFNPFHLFFLSLVMNCAPSISDHRVSYVFYDIHAIFAL